MPAALSGEMTVRNRVRELRERRGWSRSDLAVRAGVSERTVSNYEDPDRDQGGLIAIYLAFARAFETTVDDIIVPE